MKRVCAAFWVAGVCWLGGGAVLAAAAPLPQPTSQAVMCSFLPPQNVADCVQRFQNRVAACNQGATAQARQQCVYTLNAGMIACRAPSLSPSGRDDCVRGVVGLPRFSPTAFNVCSALPGPELTACRQRAQASLAACDQAANAAGCIYSLRSRLGNCLSPSMPAANRGDCARSALGLPSSAHFSLPVCNFLTSPARPACRQRIQDRAGACGQASNPQGCLNNINANLNACRAPGLPEANRANCTLFWLEFPTPPQIFTTCEILSSPERAACRERYQGRVEACYQAANPPAALSCLYTLKNRLRNCTIGVPTEANKRSCVRNEVGLPNPYAQVQAQVNALLNQINSSRTQARSLCLQLEFAGQRTACIDALYPPKQ